MAKCVIIECALPEPLSASTSPARLIAEGLPSSYDRAEALMMPNSDEQMDVIRHQAMRVAASAGVDADTLEQVNALQTKPNVGEDRGSRLRSNRHREGLAWLTVNGLNETHGVAPRRSHQLGIVATPKSGGDKPRPYGN